MSPPKAKAFAIHSLAHVQTWANAEDHLVKDALRLALPATGEQILSLLVGLVDTFLVGHLGAASLAAVGLSNQWVMLVMTFFGAVGTGTTALIARATGAGDETLAQRTLRQSLLLGLLLGFLASFLAYSLAGSAIALLGAKEDASGLAIVYLRTVALVLPLSGLMFIGNAAMRGAGDTRTPLKVMLAVNLINITVAWVLINGPLGLPRFGVLGSALGAVAGRLTGGVLVVFWLFQGRANLQLCLRGMRLDIPLIRRVLHVGLPTGIEQLLFRFALMTFVAIIASLGTAAYAAHQVAIDGESLSFMPGFGFGVAATTLVGQNLGARKPERARYSGYLAYGLGGGLMSIMGLVFFLFARQIVGFFTDDPQVIALGATPLRMVAIVQPFLAAAIIFAGALRGAGDTRYPMFVNGASAWCIRVPLAYLLAHVLGLGLTGAWMAMIIDLTVRGTLEFVRFRGGRWTHIQV